MSDTVRTTPEPERSGVTVQEAAETLGISEVAVRARLRRGTLEGEKVDNAWRVFLRTTDVPEHSDSTYQDTQHGTQHGTQRRVPLDALVEQLLHERGHLQGEIDYLRMELAKRSQELATERERSDILQREALDRIEALSASVSGETDDQDAAHHDVENVQYSGLWARLVRFLTGH